jgi:hypothetical protein
MKKMKPSIEQLVIEANPAAQVTYEIVQQLVKELPLMSSDQFKERLGRRGLKVGGSAVSVEQILGLLPANLFPIRDAKDLIVKVAAAIRVGVDVITRADRFPDDAAQARLVMTLAREPQKRAEIATGYFGGPSLFGGKRAKKTGERKGA